jgi:hypothetical protein
VVIGAAEGRQPVTLKHSVDIAEINAFGFSGRGEHSAGIPDNSTPGFGIGIGLGRG